jgi:DNA-binding NarL/FixJ family response regulator
MMARRPVALYGVPAPTGAGQADGNGNGNVRRRATVHLVARHRLVAEALRSLLSDSGELEIVAVQTLAEASADPGPHVTADVLLLDVPAFDAAERAFLVQLGRDGPAPPVVLVVEHLDPPAARQIAQAGVRGLLDRSSSADAFVMAVRQVIGGQVVMPSRAASWVAAPDEPDAVNLLSDRQRAVLELAAHGRSNQEIASELFISVNTVKFHMRDILHKLGSRNRVEAALRWSEMERLGHG